MASVSVSVQPASVQVRVRTPGSVQVASVVTVQSPKWWPVTAL